MAEVVHQLCALLLICYGERDTLVLDCFCSKPLSFPLPFTSIWFSLKTNMPGPYHSQAFPLLLFFAQLVFLYAPLRLQLNTRRAVPSPRSITYYFYSLYCHQGLLTVSYISTTLQIHLEDQEKKKWISTKPGLNRRTFSPT